MRRKLEQIGARSSRKGTLRLSDDQLAEVRRRRSEKNPKTITLAELNTRLHRRYGV
jgi:hypothetical protein